MTAPAVSASISFERVWKKFRTGEMHDSLRDLIPAIGRRLFKRSPDPIRRREGEFWALRDVSFDVQPGEVLGIIGGNGAGKSTALKILTKILRPTAGQASVRGRIGALIEISAGFHQDLTGRENVFLQGSIMGMPVALIRRKFDEIVEFAGLEKFIDTPVKRYSSGMNARLGFAIAAHLDPEVLIIDEVLAVGDFRFQDKAFGRIRDMSRSGIPVVLVSHQLDRVATLCTKALLLHQGQVMCQGPVAECIDAYLSGGTSLSAPSHPDSPIVLGAIRILQGETLQWGQQADLELEAVIPGRNREAFDSIGLRFRALEGSREVFMTSTRFADIRLPDHGKVRVLVSIRMCLPAGTYSMEPFAWRPGEDTIIATGPISTCHVGRAHSTLNRGIVDLEPRLAVSTLSDGAAPE
ncbi:MAG TPA: ABC transporter ATP-binding protein [Gemmatimonadales bacterium]|nr:ABC transporter ATP-binding protein [Gemmatimonadales bacterium]